MHEWIQTSGGIVLPDLLLGSNKVSISTMVDGGRNTQGNFVGSVLGNDKLSIDLSFVDLTPTEMMNFLKIFDRAQGGSFINNFIVLDPRTNTWVTKKMYVGDRSGRPLRLDPSTGKPTGWAEVETKLVEV